MKDNKNRLFEMMCKVTGMSLNENEMFNDNINDDELDWKTSLLKDLNNNGIYPESYFGKIFSIKCKGDYDFEIEFYSDGIKIVEYDGVTKKSNENIFKEYEDVLSYILNKKDLFITNTNSTENANNNEY